MAQKGLMYWICFVGLFFISLFVSPVGKGDDPVPWPLAVKCPINEGEIIGLWHIVQFSLPSSQSHDSILMELNYIKIEEHNFQYEIRGYDNKRNTIAFGETLNRYIGGGIQLEWKQNQLSPVIDPPKYLLRIQGFLPERMTDALMCAEQKLMVLSLAPLFSTGTNDPSEKQPHFQHFLMEKIFNSNFSL